jgi:hypothetical protein
MTVRSHVTQVRQGVDFSPLGYALEKAWENLMAGSRVGGGIGPQEGEEASLNEEEAFQELEELKVHW